ncbi:MAG: hypothetical protein K8F91_21685, partial [Candidatus Obscuribacterales bacterium]|nr:hypothetical protein [Candidatus Obscuribacterales bacterium]
MSRKALLVYNPSAGTAMVPELWLGRVIHRLNSSLVDQTLVLTTSPEMTSADILTELDKDIEILVAAGGDGTIRLALEAAARSEFDPAVAIIPVGTGNQLARNLGICDDALINIDPLEKAIRALLGGHRQKIDLGIMNGNYFAVAAGAGPMSDAIVTPEQINKINWKMLAYVSSLVQTLTRAPVVFDIVADGESFRVAASGLFVTNIADFGVGSLSETAKLNDGLLDLVILAPTEFQDYLELGFAFAGASIGEEASYYIKKVREVSVDVLPLSRRQSVVEGTVR